MRNNAKTQLFSWVIPMIVILIGVYLAYLYIM